VKFCVALVLVKQTVSLRCHHVIQVERQRAIAN
jgi:hypothetical protein